MTPDHINPVQWQQAMGIARQACARIFRDGGSPMDALDTFGIQVTALSRSDWSRAVELIARALCSEPLRRAA